MDAEQSQHVHHPTRAQESAHPAQLHHRYLVGRLIAENEANADNSLDALESPVDHQRALSFGHALQFGTAIGERELWLGVIDQLDLPFKTRERFKTCGDHPSVEYCPDTDRVRIQANHCKSRFCPKCRTHRQARWRETLKAAVTSLPNAEWKLITLTLKHCDDDLKTQLNHLRKSFRRLRQTDLWKQRIKWGIAVIEVSYNKTKDQWHPHLHILAPCNFIDYSKLRTCWMKATGGSHIIDVQRLSTPEHGISYLAKYLGKPPSVEVFLKEHRIHEYVDALRCAKMLLPFGSYPEAAKPKKKEKSPHEWVRLGSLAEVLADAERGFDPAIQALTRIAAKITRWIDNKPPAQLENALNKISDLAARPPP